MAFTSSNSEQMIFRRAPRTDTYGDLIGTAQDTPVDGCLFAPGATGEQTNQSQQDYADATVYAPEDAPALTASDQIVIRGEVWNVAGRPKLWLNEGYEIPVRLVNG